jgi:hypothetical protein
MEYPKKEDILYTCITENLKNKNGKVLEESEKGIMISDPEGFLFILAADDTQTAKDWLIKHEQNGYPLLVLFDQKLSEWAKERYHKNRSLPCYQVVYEKKTAPEL